MIPSTPLREREVFDAVGKDWSITFVGRGKTAWAWVEPVTATRNSHVADPIRQILNELVSRRTSW